MRRIAGCLLAAALCCLALAGCGAAAPERAADGTDWSEHWVTVGGLLGVDTPAGMEHQENNEALAANGMYYATWSIGEAVPYVNEDGEDAQLYDAQIYLLLSEHRSAETAEETMAAWLELASARYHGGSGESRTCGGQDFTVCTYTFDSDTNPYARGASAFGVYQNAAISAEIACRADFDGDALELLTDFLDHCHYGA